MADVTAGKKIAACANGVFHAKMFDPNGLSIDDLTDKSDYPVKHLALNHLCISHHHEGKSTALQLFHHAENCRYIL